MLNTILFPGGTILIVENENDLQKIVNVFDSVCKRRELKVNINKIKVIVLEMSKGEVVDSDCLY